jgi:hypothetical protein
MGGFGVREMDRWSVLERVRRGDVTQVQAAERLGLCRCVGCIARKIGRTFIDKAEGIDWG